MTVWNKWQVKYDRVLNRKFNNSKIDSVREPFRYTSTEKTIDYCIKSFVEKLAGIGLMQDLKHGVIVNAENGHH